MKRKEFGLQPTPDQPLLTGLLVDVSASMKSSIRNRSGKTLSRIESLRNALDDLVIKGKEISRIGSSEKIAPLIKIFAYGFGFGNPLSFVFGGGGPEVRDLLEIPGEALSTVSIDELANNWRLYRQHIENLIIEMGGNTPMGEGFHLLLKRVKWELENNKFTAEPVLFILSDGKPTDVSPNEVIKLAEKLKQLGVIIISCYITEAEVVEWRHAYGSPLPDWPDGAKLMFECASVISPDSPFYTYLRENKFEVEKNGRIFTQINQSETLSIFLNSVLSPLDKSMYLSDEEVKMIDTFAVPVLLKAVDFLFGEGSKILEARRKRRTGQDIVESEDAVSTKNSVNTIRTRDEALKLKFEEVTWSASERKIEHLMNLLDTYTKNYYLAREQYAQHGQTMVPEIIVHRMEEAEKNIASATKELQQELSKIYGKKVSVIDT